jgi:hypothetical protein
MSGFLERNQLVILSFKPYPLVTHIEPRAQIQFQLVVLFKEQKAGKDKLFLCHTEKRGKRAQTRDRVWA